MIKQPLSLPQGSVRALIAIGITATACFLWATGAVVPPELLVTAGTVIAYYFAFRTSTAVPQTPEVVIPEPYIPADN